MAEQLPSSSFSLCSLGFLMFWCGVCCAIRGSLSCTDKLPEDAVAVLVLITQQKRTVTLCMQTSASTSQPALSFTTTLDQTAMPNLVLLSPAQELQHLQSRTRSRNTVAVTAPLSCSRKPLLGGGLVTLSKAIERLWGLLLQREVFHSGARTLSRGALTVVKPLPEEHTSV